MKGKKSNSITIGVVFILIGIVWAGNTLGVLQVDLFTRGWWTLFIIIPSTVHFIFSDQKVSALEGIAVGFILMASSRGLITYEMAISLLVASIFVMIGLNLMTDSNRVQREETHRASYGSSTRDSSESGTYSQEESYFSSDDFFRQKREEEHGQEQRQESSQDSQNVQEECPQSMNACLGGKAYSITGEFIGTSIQTVLGNVQLDLRQAKISGDCTIQVNLVLGGVNVYLPENVRIINSCQNILAEVRDVRRNRGQEVYDAPTIHLTGNCILGGLELA